MSPEPEVPAGEPVSVTDDQARAWMEVLKAQRDAAAQHADAFSDEYAVEKTDVRGNKRIDYEGVPLRNADGTLNAAGKAFLEIYEPADRVEQEVVEKAAAGDFDERPETEADRERKARRAKMFFQAGQVYARRNGLKPAGQWGDGTMENRWRDKSGRLLMLTFAMSPGRLDIDHVPLSLASAMTT